MDCGLCVRALVGSQFRLRFAEGGVLDADGDESGEGLAEALSSHGICYHAFCMNDAPRVNVPETRLGEHIESLELAF